MNDRAKAKSGMPRAALMAVALVGLLACRGEEPSPYQNSLKGFNLIIVTIDSLRRDHVGCYGYERPTTPFIDSVATSGVVFEDAMSNSSWTMESVTTMWTGLPVSANAALAPKYSGALPSSKTLNLAPLFKQAGYRTGLFSNNMSISTGPYPRGFDETEFWPEKEQDKPPKKAQDSPTLTARALKFIEEHQKRRFMLYLHYQDPHANYEPPAEYYKRFAKDIFPEPVRLYDDLRPNLNKFVAEGFGPGDPRFEDMVTRYDAEISETDDAIKVLFEGLKELELHEKTLVVIVSDHGEEFLEHGFVEHAWAIYNEVLQAPLIFWAPRVFEPRRIKGRVSNVNLLPTLVYLLEVPHDRRGYLEDELASLVDGFGYLDGGSFLEHDGPGFVFKPPSEPYIAELHMQHRSILRAVIVDDWKYITAMKWLRSDERDRIASDPYKYINKEYRDIWGPVVYVELFNLKADPGERHNLLPANTKHSAEAIHQQEKLGAVLRVYNDFCIELGYDPRKGRLLDAPGWDPDGVYNIGRRSKRR